MRSKGLYRPQLYIYAHAAIYAIQLRLNTMLMKDGVETVVDRKFNPLTVRPLLPVRVQL